jgi:DNA (cytosine-5)-methyltransferase 1
MGFDAEWGVLSAADVGANHERERIWIVAKQRNIFSHTEHDRDGWRKQQQESVKEKIINTSSKNVERQRAITIGTKSEFGDISDASWWQSEPNVGRVADGVAARVDRLKAIGNGQVPLCAATAWELLK